MGMMVLLGVATLVWYYGRQISRQSHLRQARQVAESTAAGAEMTLPPLGTAESPARPPAARPHFAASPTMAAATPEPVLGVAPLSESPASFRATGSPRAPAAPGRRLQGDVYAALSAATPGADASGHAAMSQPSDLAEAIPASLSVPGGAGAGQSGLLATPDSIPAAARRLRDRSLLLSKGTFIDCTLETAIDSTLPGITSCVTASDTFSADGRVVLLERGTRLFGETQGQVQQGSARVYVLWTEARTPAGVVVPLESPGTDALGRAGLPGTVQRHFWERFGAAILLSSIDSAVQAAVQASSRNSGTVIYNPSATQDVMTEVLKSTVAIAPTVIKRNGDRIEVLVARDVDFANVYVLHAAQAGE
jgi:type IV secretion system protein VirB10